MSGLNFEEVQYVEPGEGAKRVTQTLDIDLVRPRFEDFKRKAETIAIDARAVKIIDAETLSLAVSIGGNAKKIVKAIEVQRKAIIFEPSEFIDAVNGICRMITDKLKEAAEITGDKVTQHQARVEMERRERERQAMEAARKLQEELRREAEEANKKAMEEARERAEEEAREKRLHDEEEAKKRKASEAEMETLAKKAEEERLAAIKQAEDEATKMAVEAPTVIPPTIPKEQKAVRTESGTAAHQRKDWTFEIVNEAEIPREYLMVDEKRIREAVGMGTREINGVRIFEKQTTIFRT